MINILLFILFLSFIVFVTFTASAIRVIKSEIEYNSNLIFQLHNEINDYKNIDKDNHSTAKRE